MIGNCNYLCFVDSNIWLYAFSTNNKEETKRILAKQIIQEKQIVISTQVINEVLFNLFKKHKLDEVSILNLIKSFYNHYQVVQFNQNIYELASNLRSNYCLSFWDSLIVASALFANADILYSEDMQHNLIFDDSLISTRDIINLAEKSHSFDFLKNEPDIYTLEDGEPI